METKMIGNKIAEARKKINISQAQLAEHLFMSAQAVGKWERGESIPDIVTINRLAEILGVDLNYFSENFQSAAAERTPVISSERHPAELPAGKQEKKLSWDMSGGNWVDADFSGLKNLHEKFSGSNMKNCKFISSDLSGLLLKRNNVDGCDFSGSDISNSQIQGSNLARDIFKDCSLQKTEFSGSNIEGCNFTGANFTETEFSKCYLYDCDLTHVDFTGVKIKSGGFSGAAKPQDPGKNTITDAVWNRTAFTDTQIADLVFTGTIEDCSFENVTFTRVTFRNATFINTFFKNNNLKRVRFIDCQADRMTCEFLKSGKADMSGITLLSQ